MDDSRLPEEVQDQVNEVFQRRERRPALALSEKIPRKQVIDLTQSSPLGPTAPVRSTTESRPRKDTTPARSTIESSARLPTSKFCNSIGLSSAHPLIPVCSRHTDSPVRQHDKIVHDLTESPPPQSSATANSGSELPPERPARPLCSTTESLQQPPTTPDQTTTTSHAQRSVISISSTEYPARDAATPIRNVTESPCRQSAISDSSTREPAARQSLRSGQNIRRPTVSPITPTGDVQDVDATADTIDQQPVSEDRSAPLVKPAKRRSNRLKAATVVDGGDVGKHADEQPLPDTAPVSLEPWGRQANEDTATSAANVPAHIFIDMPNVSAHISVASVDDNGKFRDIAGAQSCQLSETATVEQVHQVVRIRFGHELNRLHYPYEIKVCCYRMQIPDRSSYVAYRKYKKTSEPYEYFEIISELRARGKPVYLQVCLFDERNAVFKKVKNAYMLADEVREERDALGKYVRVRAPSPASSDADEGNSDKEVTTNERRYRQLLGSEKDAVQGRHSEAYERRMKMEYWQQVQELRAELKRERGVSKDEESGVSAAEESEASEPSKKRVKHVEQAEETVEEEENSESSSSECFEEPDDTDDDDYKE